jgi:hypothetical protein
MASSTHNYGLATAVATDDLVEAAHHNRIADTLDRALGELVQRVLSSGALEGWEVTNAKQVSAGDGLIGACWCSTTAAQSITGLTNGALNYIYAVLDEGSAPHGSVQFVGQMAPPGPGGSILLGTLELDGAGEAIAVDNAPADVQRSCHPLRFAALAGTGVVTALPGGQSASVVVDHSASGVFRLPGDLRVSAQAANTEVVVSADHQGDQFGITVRNLGGSPVDAAYGWTREGVLQ